MPLEISAHFPKVFLILRNTPHFSPLDLPVDADSYNCWHPIYFAGKKKSKFKTVSLNEFLTDESGKPPPSYAPSSTSWADQMDNVECDGNASNRIFSPEAEHCQIDTNDKLCCFQMRRTTVPVLQCGLTVLPCLLLLGQQEGLLLMLAASPWTHLSQLFLEISHLTSMKNPLKSSSEGWPWVFEDVAFIWGFSVMTW